MLINTTWYKKAYKFKFFAKSLIDKFMNLEDIQNLLTSANKFDVLIMTYPLSDVYLGFADHFNIPVILFVPTGSLSYVNYHTGNIDPYSYVPHVLLPFSDQMTFLQRVINTLVGLLGELINTFFIMPEARDLLKKYFPEAQSLDELYDRIALVLINSHYSTETPRPYTPNMIQIGGFAVDEFEPLPIDLQNYLDEAKGCAIYFSFGTNIKISIMSDDKVKIILNTLSKSKCKILWNIDVENIQGKPINVRTEIWLPQKSILGISLKQRNVNNRHILIVQI